VGGLVQRAVTGARYIAFGPYLSLAVILTLFFRRECFEILLITWPRLVRHTLGLE